MQLHEKKLRISVFFKIEILSLTVFISKTEL